MEDKKEKFYSKDTNPKMKYEYPNIFRLLLNFPILIIMSLFPYKISKIFIKKSNKKAAHVHKNITTHAALDTLYDSGKFNTKNINYISEFIEHLWFNLYNPKAVRNRLKLVNKFLEEAIIETLKTQNEIEITSLASGSARAVINTVSKFQGNNNIFFNIKFLDKSNEALNISEKIIKRYNLKNVKFEFINDRIRNFSKYYNKNKPNIIEMVGFLDYLDEEKSIKLISKINKNLKENGFLIIANINNNHEKIFLDRALRWKMNYKTPRQFFDILEKSGFNRNNIELKYEPFLIHGVAKIKKAAIQNSKL